MSEIWKESLGDDPVLWAWLEFFFSQEVLSLSQHIISGHILFASRYTDYTNNNNNNDDDDDDPNNNNNNNNNEVPIAHLEFLICLQLHMTERKGIKT